jgi:hypothetical protein
MKPEVLRIARAFACASRPADLNVLLNMKIHFLNYGKIGEQYERLLRDIESRISLDIQRYDNYFADKEKEAIQKYKEIKNDNDSGGEENKTIRKAKG